LARGYLLQVSGSTCVLVASEGIIIKIFEKMQVGTSTISIHGRRQNKRIHFLQASKRPAVKRNVLVHDFDN